MFEEILVTLGVLTAVLTVLLVVGVFRDIFKPTQEEHYQVNVAHSIGQE